jgi:hypothetical protein
VKPLFLIPLTLILSHGGERKRGIKGCKTKDENKKMKKKWYWYLGTILQWASGAVCALGVLNGIFNKDWGLFTNLITLFFFILIPFIAGTFLETKGKKSEQGDEKDKRKEPT